MGSAWRGISAHVLRRGERTVVMQSLASEREELIREENMELRHLLVRLWHVDYGM